MPISTLCCEVDALDLLQEAVHEMLARLLAVGDDVQAGVLLRLDPQQRGIGLGLRSASPSASIAATACGFGQPAGLGQAAGDGSFEHP
jgi:hypothetical protein